MNFIDKARSFFGFNPRQSLGYGASGASVGAYYTGPIDQFTQYRNISRIVRELPVVQTGMTYYQDMLGSLEWRFEPAEMDMNGKPTPMAQEYADIASMLIFDDPKVDWVRLVRRASLYRFYGFSLNEWILGDREDGLVGFEDIQDRSWRWVTYWDEDRETGKLTHAHYYGGRIPIEKCLYLVTNSFSPVRHDGWGILQMISPEATKLLRLMQIEYRGYETDLRGRPIGWVPPDVTDEEKQAVETAVTQQVHNPNTASGLILSSEPYESIMDTGNRPIAMKKFDFNLIRGDGTGLTEIRKAIQEKDLSLARAIGIEGLWLGDVRGTQALARDKSSQFSLRIDAMTKDIESAVQRDLVETLWTANNFPWEMLPKIKAEKADFRTVDEIIETLARTQNLPHQEDPAIDEIRMMDGLPARTEIPQTEEDEV